MKVLVTGGSSGLGEAVAAGAAAVLGTRPTPAPTVVVDDVVGSSPMWAVPVNSSNDPRTFVTMAWRATKPMRLWVGSMA